MNCWVSMIRVTASTTASRMGRYWAPRSSSGTFVTGEHATRIVPRIAAGACRSVPTQRQSGALGGPEGMRAACYTRRAMAANDLRRLYAYRGLLQGLVRRDLQVKYKGSVLGVAWSLL